MTISDVPFNNVPSNILVPFFWGEFNSGGSPYENFPRPLLVGQKTSAGAAPTSKAYGPIMSHNDAVAQFGVNSMLVGSYDMAAAAAPLQPFWALVLADPSGSKAAGSIHFTAPGVTGEAILYIIGRECTFQVNSSDTAAMVAANAIAAINALDLPIIATLGGTSSEICELTAAHVGLLSNGLEVLVATDQPNVLNGANAAVTALTGGTGTPDLATPLANLGSTQYDWIASPYADTTSLNEVRSFLSDQSGRWSPSQQLFGHYTTAMLGSSLSTLVSFGNGRNDQHVTVFGGWGSGASPSAPWEVAASLVGIEALHLANPPELSRPLQTLQLPGIVPPRDASTWWTVTERQALYSDGIAGGTVTVDGICAIDRMVTTYQQTAQGVSDQTFLDIETMAQGMFSMRYIRVAETNAHGRQAFADENPFDLAEICTPNDVRNTAIFAYNDLCALGVAQHPELFAQYVVAQKDPLDPDRCNLYVPENVIGQLRVLAANVTAYRSYTGPSGSPLVPSAPTSSAALTP